MADFLVEAVGWLGAVLIMTAYFLISSKKVHGRSKTYHLMNLVGGASVAFNSLINSALPSVGLNTVWSSIAIYGLYRSFRPEQS
ncbi:MAG: hypothetical protein QXI97_04055 [Nitrososphaerota archaeon]